MTNSFRDNKKFCPCCNAYVLYLASVEQSFCVECGSEVRLFSDSDWVAFQQKMADRKPKGGRPRKGAGRRGRRTAAA